MIMVPTLFKWKILTTFQEISNKNQTMYIHKYELNKKKTKQKNVKWKENINF